MSAGGRTSSRGFVSALGLFWLVCVSLHVWRLATGDLGWVPVHVRADPTGGPPVVRGFLTGGDDERAGALRVGDRLLRIGDRALEGAGPFDFALAVYEQAGVGRAAHVAFERSGIEQSEELALRPLANPWRTLPLVLTMGGLSLLALWRAGTSGNARAFGYAGLTYSLHWALFPGGPRWLSAVSLAIALGTSGLNLPLVLRAIARLAAPGRPRNPVLRLAPWLFVASAPATASWLLGWPFAGELGLRWLMALNGAGLITAVVLVVIGFRRADALGRRQLKWAAWGFYVGVAPVIAGALLAGLDARWVWLYELSVLATVMIPIGFYVAIVRYQFGDIDRLISATASYNLLLVGLVAAGLVLVPRTAQAASQLLGVDSSFGQVAVSLLLALVIVPAHRQLQPVIERTFFRERIDLEKGVAALLEELSRVREPRELLVRVGERLAALLRPDGCVLYARDGEHFAPVFVRGRTIPASLPADGSLVSAIASLEAPSRADRLVRDASLRGLDRALVATLDAALIVPVRRDGKLTAFCALGSKQSGDVYTSTDQALLASVAHQVTSQWVRFDQAEVIAQTRSLQEALRRFVPGAVAEELISGRDLEAAERECSLLFVDIRGYTSYSEGHGAPEIFSTVNEYTRRVSAIVRARGGSVVEFNGDGMMAVFGAPQPLGDKERQAVLAGREIVRTVPDIPLEAGETPLTVGVGVATGDVFVGSIQAADRAIWTAIGNHVNLAARLQALTRDVDASIVIDAMTYERAADGRVAFVPRPGTEIRGRSEGIDVYVLPIGVEA